VEGSQAVGSAAGAGGVGAGEAEAESELRGGAT